jgi:hypothetical protein
MVTRASQRDDSGDGGRDMPELLGAVARDAGALVGQHLDLFQSEIRQDVREVGLGLAEVGAGAGLAATAGVLGALAMVHKLHSSTRLPLWACYGVVGGLAAALGAGLIATGARRVAGLQLVPRETIAALTEDIEWVKDQANLLTSGGRG